MTKSFFIHVVLFCSIGWGYTNITPAALHQRLVTMDTLVILDVREWSEYTANHIAEPTGQLPLTPANMPWTGGVLSANVNMLPRDVDIIVHCQSGGRSALASAFLDSCGFTRIFNMTGGFSSWNNVSYEKRSGGFGDHSGHWVRSLSVTPDTIRNDSGLCVFYPATLSGMDSLYCEIHFAYGRQPAPADAPISDIAGLFRFTALDKFGLSLFTGDSLVLHDTAGITLLPRPKSGPALPALTQPTGTALAGRGNWQQLTFDYSPQTFAFHRSERVLRRWYNVAGFSGNAVRFRPETEKRGQMNLHDRNDSRSLRLYDLRGRRIAPPTSYCSAPLTAVSGYYIVVTPRERLHGIALDRSLHTIR
jgi:rhodanese-related sulfurtransferase